MQNIIKLIGYYFFTGRKLAGKGIGADTFGAQLGAVDTQVYDVRRLIPQRLDELDQLRRRLNGFNDNVAVVDNAVTKIENDLESQGPVAADKVGLCKRYTS